MSGSRDLLRQASNPNSCSSSVSQSNNGFRSSNLGRVILSTSERRQTNYDLANSKIEAKELLTVSPRNKQAFRFKARPFKKPDVDPSVYLSKRLKIRTFVPYSDRKKSERFTKTKERLIWNPVEIYADEIRGLDRSVYAPESIEINTNVIYRCEIDTSPR